MTDISGTAYEKWRIQESPTRERINPKHQYQNYWVDNSPILEQRNSSRTLIEATKECAQVMQHHSLFVKDSDGIVEAESGHEDNFRTMTWHRYAKQSEAIEPSRKGKIDTFMQWGFDCLQLPHGELIGIAWKPFTVCKIEEQFHVPHDRLSEFMKVVQSHYRKENSFHNFYHAVDTLHSAFLISTTTAAQYSLKSLDLFSIFIAALCHDIDHPGHSQNLEIHRESKLALLYNDTAVLESYHAYKTIQILKAEPTNILCNLSHSQYQFCRQSIITSILATDMSKHFTMLDQLKDYAKNGTHTGHECELQTSKCHERDLQIVGFNPMSGTRTDASLRTYPIFNRDKHSHRLELAKCIVHTADLSGQALPYEQAKEWGNRIVNEFRNEREQHEKEGLCPPTFTQNIDSCCQELLTQSSFIGKIVLPLWESMHGIVGCLEVPVTHLRRNKDLYEREAGSNGHQELTNQ